MSNRICSRKPDGLFAGGQQGVYHKASSSQRQSLQSSYSGGASLTRKPRKDVKDDRFGGKLNDYVPVVGRKSAQSRKRT